MCFSRSLILSKLRLVSPHQVKSILLSFLSVFYKRKQCQSDFSCQSFIVFETLYGKPSITKARSFTVICHFLSSLLLNTISHSKLWFISFFRVSCDCGSLQPSNNGKPIRSSRIITQHHIISFRLCCMVCGFGKPDRLRAFASIFINIVMLSSKVLLLPVFNFTSWFSVKWV